MVNMNALAAHVLVIVYLDPTNDHYPVVRTFRSTAALRRHADDELAQEQDGQHWQTLARLAESGADTGRSGDYWLRRQRVL